MLNAVVGDDDDGHDDDNYILRLPLFDEEIQLDSFWFLDNIFFSVYCIVWYRVFGITTLTTRKE